MESTSCCAPGVAPPEAVSNVIRKADPVEPGTGIVALSAPSATFTIDTAVGIRSPEDQIRAELLAIESGVGDVLARILHCGNLFRAQKERLAHGDFGAWLEREFPTVHRRGVNRWMRAADAYNEQKRNGHGVSNSTSLRGLLGMEKPSKTKKKQPSITDIDDKLTKVIEALDKLPGNERARFQSRMVKRLRPTIGAKCLLQMLDQVLGKSTAVAKEVHE
jgi:hypothetical protein